MDTTNDLLSPQLYPNSEFLSPQLSAKRKRDESSTPNEHLSNGEEKSNGISAARQDLQEMIADLLDVLESQDNHAILFRPIQTTGDSSEPQAKRQRAESESASLSTSTTIRARAASGIYQTLDEVISDIDKAANAVSKDLQLPQGSLSKQNFAVPKREVDLVMEISAFRKTARVLVERQKELLRLRTNGRTNGESATQETMANGNGSKAAAQVTAKGDGKVVLTLYGGAGNGKQLFSSLQHSVHETDVPHPLREVGLPNGITTTHIVPAKPLDLTDEKKRKPTFGELFTSSNSLSLHPPKPSKNAATRSSVVGWYNPSAYENNKPRSSSYFGQPISTGQWLEYNSASKSPESMRKQRDRALSLSGKPPPPESDHEDDELKQLESLFRSAYSSFAPTKDETAAVAPEGTVNRIWWRHVGERSYERFLRNSEHLEGFDDSETVPRVAEIEQEELNFDEPEDEFDTWVPADAIDPDLQDTPAPKSIHDKEVEEVLKEISELLETLNSYQRIRNLSLNQTPRPAGGLASADPTASVTIPAPTESEQATYEILKSQLSIMISQLPPYAVAKLNSDQLADLSISTRIPIEMEYYKGIMEEDEISARAKFAAMNAASTVARAAPSPTSYSRTPTATALYGNQYGSTSRSALSGAYYSHTPARQPPTSMNNLPRASGSQGYPSQAQYTPRPGPVSGFRPAPTATPTYPHQAPHLSQSFGQSNTPSTYFQQQTPQTQRFAPNMSNTHSGIANSTPQAMMNGRYAPTTHQNYQQRTSISQTPNGMNYQYNQNIPRQTSPQKPLQQNSYNSPQPAVSQPQRNFSTPTSAQDPSRTYFQRQMSNGTSSSQAYPPRPHQVSTTNNNGIPNYLSTAGYATVMTDAEQKALLQKNERTLAHPTSAELAARATAQARAMSGVQHSGMSHGGDGQVDGGVGLAALVEFNKSAS